MDTLAITKTSLIEKILLLFLPAHYIIAQNAIIVIKKFNHKVFVIQIDYTRNYLKQLLA